jgi:putative ABC transport system permease protein
MSHRLIGLLHYGKDVFIRGFMKSRSAALISHIRISLRYIQRHIWQTLLMVTAIMLGVAVIIGVDIANQSASQAFDLSTNSIKGRATHYLSSGSSGLDEDVYTSLKRDGFMYPSAPIISFYITSPQLGGVTLQVIGIDAFSDSPFRNFVGRDSLDESGISNAFLTTPNSVLMSQVQAEKYLLDLGSDFDIFVDGKTHSVSIAGLLSTADKLNQRALNELLIMDIATAQEISGKIGFLDRVELILPDNQPDLITAIQSSLPGNVVLLSIDGRTSIVKELTDAFQVNLTALSLLAMLVALFLIYNTMTFSVLQRRHMFGILRSLGMTRIEIFILILIESFLMGVAGAILGTILGLLLGRGTVGLVTQTINDLFFVTTVRDLPVPVGSVIKGIVIGITATIATAAFPALEAVRIPPLSAMTRSNQESGIKMNIAGISLTGLIIVMFGAGTLLIPTRNLTISFAGTFLIVIGLAMLIPKQIIIFMNLIGKITPRIWGGLGRLAPREVINSLSRTAIAVAALMISVAVTIGVTLMINSFRLTVVTWLDQILQGDIYISVAGSPSGQPTFPLDPNILVQLENFDGIENIYSLQTSQVESLDGPILIAANNNPNDGMEQIYLSNQVPVEQMWSELESGSVLITEPLMNRLDLPQQGGELALYTEQGLISFPIAGVIYDYSSSQGSALFAQIIYQEYWPDENIAALSLILEPGMDVDLTAQKIKEYLAGGQRLLIRPNQAIRQETLDIFERTFAITTSLQIMTTIVAFIGILSALMNLQLDKKRQLGILRALGLTGKQLWTLVMLETGLMGTVAGLTALPTGYILSLILIYIINKRSFGWTMQISLDIHPFIQAVLLAIIASLLAGILPTRQTLKQNPADVIRYG